jgi:hypothetical protein
MEILQFLTKFDSVILQIAIASLLMIVAALALYWMRNKRRYQALSHQIPATVVKNYLDSIIQNSNSLKSSLFRGGGLDIGGGTPSVLPLDSMTSVSGIPKEEYDRVLASLNEARLMISTKDQKIAELEALVASLKNQAGKSNVGGVPEEIHQKVVNENADLKKQLKALSEAAAKGSEDPEMANKLLAMTKERDDLKDRLQEYEIIEDDLANLKRLQQENEQLKKQLEGKSSDGETVAAAPVVEAVAPVAVAAVAAAVEEPKAEVAEVAAADTPAIDGEGKSAEDLLSEFEKMLG